MKNIAIIFSLIIFLFTNSYSRDIQGKDFTESFLYGLYGKYPVLSDEKKSQIIEEKHSIEAEIKALEDSIINLNEKINYVHKTDTVKIRKHSIFLGGMFTIPVLSDAEKRKKKKLEPLKTQFQDVQDLKTELVQELDEINILLEKDKKYFEKKILWGFIIWEEEKE